MNLADIQAAAGLRTPIRHQLFIDGQFVPAQSGETLATLNPHDNSPIADVAMAGKAESTSRGRRAARLRERVWPADRGASC
jgi:betaine-aldehyde dehydrogenase